MQISMGSKTGRQTGIIGRIFGSLFCLFFGVLGATFSWLIIAETWRTAMTFQWPAERCEVEETRVSTPPSRSGGRFEPFVRYRYSVHGLPQSSTQIGKFTTATDDVGEAQRLIDRFPVGARVPCYINPDDASDAILIHGSLLKGGFVILPLIFVVIGFGGLYLILFSKPDSPAPTRTPPISKLRKSELGGRIGLACFFGVFFAVGALFMVLILKEALQAIASASWPARPCKVISSDLRRDDSGDDGPSYRVDVLYEYEVNGRTLQSNVYRALKMSSGGYAANKAIVERYKPGDTINCYVNPDDPTYAVLETGVGWGLLILLIPGVFVAVGLGGIIFAFRASTTSSAPHVPRSSSAPSSSPSLGSGPRELKAASSPLARFGGLTFFALFWNGITGVFVWHLVSDAMSGSINYFLGIFLIPFVLIGALVAIASISAFFALFLPRPKLTISADVIPLGGSATLTWAFDGNTNRIRSITISLIGSEEVRYTRGTTTQTDKREFYRDEFFKLSAIMGQKQGSATFKVPADSMHSFHASNNKIIWNVRFEGDVPLSPNIREEYEIQVSPAPLSTRDR